MPEHAEQQVAGPLYMLVEIVDRLGYSLVDRLVEPNYILHPWLIERTGIDPQPENAGPQRPVFGDELVDVEAAPRPQDGVRLRRRLWGTQHLGGPPLGLLRLRLSGLESGEVLGHSLENVLRVVTEGEVRHVRRRR